MYRVSSHNLLKLFVKIDLFLILGFFIFPKLTIIHPLLGSLDELITLFFIATIGFKLFAIKLQTITLLPLILITISYSIFLIFYNNLPLSNIIQVLITFKYIAIFLYFSLKSTRYKVIMYKYFLYLMAILFVLSLMAILLQIVFPNFLTSKEIGRGINGITFKGIFYSRTLYSPFLVTCIVLALTVKKTAFKFGNLIFKYRVQITVFCIILILLTFTRKDLVFGLLITYLLLRKLTAGFTKRILNIGAVITICLLPIISIVLFSEINKRTFTEDQVRLIILNEAVKVHQHYSPLGSGPGTFGTIISTEYTDVYEKFKVPKHIYKGWGNKLRGPIFDVFILSFLVEYGYGIILFFLIYFSLVKAKLNKQVNQYTNVKNLRVYLILYIFLASLTLPILNNLIGYLIFTILGSTLSLKRI